MSDPSAPVESQPVAAPAERPVALLQKADEGTRREQPALDPTRYGDWEKNGRCIDF